MEVEQLPRTWYVKCFLPHLLATMVAINGVCLWKLVEIMEVGGLLRKLVAPSTERGRERFTRWKLVGASITTSRAEQSNGSFHVVPWK